MSEYKRKLADFYWNEFHSKATLSNRVFMVWSITLILIWITAFLPKLLELHDLEKTNLTYKKEQTVLKEQKEPTFDDENINTQVRINNSKSELYSKRQDLDVEFDFPIGKIKIPMQYAPLFWQILATCLLIFLFFSRISLLKLAGRMIRLHLVDLRATEDDLKHYIGGGPWWIAPIPSLNGSIVQATIYRDTLGFDLGKWTSNLLILFFFTIFLFLQAATMYVAWSFTNQLLVGIGNHVVQSIQLLLFCVTFIFILRWIYFLKIPDYYPSEESSNAITRREFLGYSAILGLFTLTSISPKLGIYKFYKNPRFRLVKDSKVTFTKLSDGWYINDHSKVIHRVFRNKIFLSNPIKTPLKVINFSSSVSGGKILSLNINEKPRVNLSKASLTFEKDALAKINSGNFDEACKLLLRGIAYTYKLKSTPNFRLYDLLAGLAIRFKKKQYINDMSKYVDLYKKLFPEEEKMHEKFVLRNNKWKNTESKWRKRWENREKKINWSGLLM